MGQANEIWGKGWPHPYSLKGGGRDWFRVRTLGYIVSVDLETDINYVGNQ